MAPDRKNPHEASRHMLRVAMGHVERKAATGRVDNPMVQKPRIPSMPALPWKQTEATRDEITGSDNGLKRKGPA